jgi:hypothetical protein
MARESPTGIFLFVFEWVVTALLSALFKKKPCVPFLHRQFTKSNDFTVYFHQFY